MSRRRSSMEHAIILDSRTPWMTGALVALGLMLWAAVVEVGLARVLFGPQPASWQEALLLIPAALAGACALARKACQRLGREVQWAWRPGEQVPGFERGAKGKTTDHLPDAKPHVTQKTVPPPSALSPQAASRSRESDLVLLGPDADPAFAAWTLEWEARRYGSGEVYLPYGDHIVLGRSPDAHIRVTLDPVSWKHLVFRVRREHVVVMDMRSSNGSELITAQSQDTLLPDRRRHMEPGDRLRLADAITFELRRVQ